MASSIATISRARQILAKADTLDDVLAIKDQMQLISAALKAAGKGLELQNEAASVKVRAERMAGEALSKLEKAKPPGKKLSDTMSFNSKSSTLSDLGLSSKEANRYEQIAEVPKRQFEEMADVTTRTEAGEEITSAELQKIGAKIRRDAKKTSQRKAALDSSHAAKTKASTDWQVINGDCVKELKKLANVNLVIADPPYNIGVDYGKGTKADQLTTRQYVAWCRRWMQQCYDCLHSTGSMWLIVSDDYVEHLTMLMNDIGFHRRAWVVWHESFGTHRGDTNFGRTARHMLYCTKDKKQFTFNGLDPLVRVKSARAEVYNDKRQSSDGTKLIGNVWGIHRVTGTSDERIPEFPTQLPVVLTDRIVAVSSNPGDLVVDPFCGSGTSGESAINQMRTFVGIEKETKWCAGAKKRIKNRTTLFAANAMRNGSTK